jgi:hypothetical protein
MLCAAPFMDLEDFFDFFVWFAAILGCVFALALFVYWWLTGGLDLLG